ncbi:MAG TPA: S9 family peptidase, partial [Pseudonocardiaceae bacterium]|nr:S9 family peptidase [Pseudonocardiaceae bacterium]
MTLVGVRERPDGPDDLVVLALEGSAPPRAIQQGHDFYAFPRVSRKARQLAWISWDDPNLPWDGSHLWVAELFDSGLDTHLGPARHVAGGPAESVTQPEWGP